MKLYFVNRYSEEGYDFLERARVWWIHKLETTSKPQEDSITLKHLFEDLLEQEMLRIFAKHCV